MFFSTISGKSFDTENVISTRPMRDKILVDLKGLKIPVELTMEEYNDYVQFMKKEK